MEPQGHARYFHVSYFISLLHLGFLSVSLPQEFKRVSQRKMDRVIFAMARLNFFPPIYYEMIWSGASTNCLDRFQISGIPFGPNDHPLQNQT